jgi:Flp pilus assembly protein TadD
MKKSFLIIIGIGLLGVFGIYQLPKGNVSNKTSAEAGGANRDAAGVKVAEKEAENQHVAPLSEALQKKIAGLKSQFDSKKDLGSLNSLIAAYREGNRLDSAGLVAEKYAMINPNVANWGRAGQLFFEAQTYALSPEKGQAMGAKAREFFEKIIEQEPNNLLIKSNLAMTYVDTPTPMKGITLLREVIEQEPTFVPALFDLGVLSIKSNQFGKAQERFAQILKLEPNNFKAALNLGFCLAQLEKKTEAVQQLQRVEKQSKDPEEVKAAKELLAEMQKH